jgi:hypothetical protein
MKDRKKYEPKDLPDISPKGQAIAFVSALILVMILLAVISSYTGRINEKNSEKSSSGIVVD